MFRFLPRRLSTAWGARRLISTQRYHELSDETLDRILGSYEGLIEDNPDIDVDLSQGVLTIQLPPVGTYVVNKQPPSKQIWLSSPVSGPKRFDFSDDGKWIYYRDPSVTLGKLLKSEAKDNLEKELDLDVD